MNKSERSHRWVHYAMLPSDHDAAGIIEREIQAHGTAEVHLAGQSMEPTLQIGDCLRICPVIEPLAPGSIVLFLSPNGELNTHRIVRVSGSMHWIRGDACSSAEGPIPADRILGKVVAYRRGEEWHTIDDTIHQRTGLLINRLVSGLRRLVDRFPHVVSLLDSERWFSKTIRKIYGRGFKLVAGEIIVQEETDTIKVIPFQVSSRTVFNPVLQRGRRRFERNGRVFLASSRKYGWLGAIVFCRDEEPGAAQQGMITWMAVRPMAMFTGLEDQLLLAVENVAKKDGLLRLVASLPNNSHRQQNVFRRNGYREIADNNRARKKKRNQHSASAGITLLSKQIGG